MENQALKGNLRLFELKINLAAVACLAGCAKQELEKWLKMEGKVLQ